jgi:hypothetical protein
MSEQREPDHSDDPRGQEVGDGYPEVQPEGADPERDEEESDDEE